MKRAILAIVVGASLAAGALVGTRGASANYTVCYARDLDGSGCVTVVTDVLVVPAGPVGPTYGISRDRALP